ncbi:MAG: M28 family peptidase [Bacteroidales bacterium]|nr:M28 family peptidase [Bacteroidales bacterium]
MRVLCLIISLFISVVSFSQSYNYAIFCKDTLTSEYMGGRAYIDNGDRRAAEFIRGELKKNNVNLLGEDGFQKVGIKVNNILEANLSVGMKGRRLELGKEFIVLGASPTCDLVLKNEKAKVISTKAELEKLKPQKLKDKVLIFNLGEIDNYAAIRFLRTLKEKDHTPKLAIIQGQDKLQYYTGRNVMSFPVVQLRDKIFSKKINRLSLSIKSEFHENYASQNVWAKVHGTKYKDSCFAFVCHYDHLGKIGSVHFPGANDNASAVAVLLDLAAYYAKNPAEHSVVFMFVTGEEVGLVGSTFAAENPLVDLSKMKFLFNLDMVGTGSTGVAVINGKKEPKAGELLQRINEENHWFSKVVLGEESCNSDHCPFVQKGVPAHFLFTYGCEYNEYHTVYDDGVELSFTKHIDFCNLLKEFIRRY